MKYVLLLGFVLMVLLSGCVGEPGSGSGTGSGTGTGSGARGSPTTEYGCEYIWYQRITDKATGEILWVCNKLHPYCKSGTTECCKYNEETKEHFDCIDCTQGRCGPSSPEYGNVPGGSEPEESDACSNSEYSTRIMNNSWAYGFDEFIALDFDSKQKLKQRMEQEGNSALQGISDLTCLEHLELSAFNDGEYINITELSALSGLTNLKVLDLKATPVSDLSPIAGLTSLEQLDLIDTDVSSLSPIANLKKLKVLRINLTNVSDLSPISGLSNLEYFSMNVVKVTDLSPLESLSSLKTADLMYNEQIPLEDCLALRNVLSNTDVCCPAAGCDPKFN